MMNFFTLKLFFNNYKKSGQIDFKTMSYVDMDERYKAPEKCIENILNFARSYKVEQTKATGKVEMILN
ncbi:MAG: hypothetical protein JW735_01530 [Prolixibacteraceae bacterium]|nr:hypothetical protein [Prolixibacteraceae bacterium]